MTIQKGCLILIFMVATGLSATDAMALRPTPPATTPTPQAAQPPQSYHIVTQEHLGDWWKTDRLRDRPPSYPPSALRSEVGGCVAIAFAIHSDGSVTPLRLLRTVAPGADRAVRKALEQAAVASMADWRYLPATANTSRSPVLTYAPFGFAIEGSHPTSSNWEKKCELPDFVQTMEQMLSTSASSKAGS